MQSVTLNHASNNQATPINAYLTNPLAGLSLVARLIASPSDTQITDLQKKLSQLQELVGTRFAEITAEDDYPNKAQAFKRLQTFPILAKRTVIGVGGALGVDRSQFLNAQCHSSLSYEETTHVSTIPTYLTHGDQQSIEAINAFNHIAMLDSDALQAINQGLAQQELSNTQAKNSFTHILRTMFVQQPEFPWQNLAFLNTACYGTVKSLQNVDQILWIVDARQGGVSKEELDFLQSLQLYRPVFFVLTQIDALSKLQCQKLIEQIRHTLYKSQIPLAGVMAWRANSNTPFVAGDDVSLWLNGLNNTAKRTGIRFDPRLRWDRRIISGGIRIKPMSSWVFWLI